MHWFSVSVLMCVLYKYVLYCVLIHNTNRSPVYYRTLHQSSVWHTAPRDPQQRRGSRCSVPSISGSFSNSNFMFGQDLNFGQALRTNSTLESLVIETLCPFGGFTPSDRLRQRRQIRFRAGRRSEIPPFFDKAIP